MKNYSESEITSLILRFEQQKLPKVEWTHEAHLVVAIWYCSHYSFNQAMDIVREKITLHNESVDTPNTDNEGYHESITKFWLIVAKRYIDANKHLPIKDLCNNLINSEIGESNYPLNFYKGVSLFSSNARKNWVEPDKRF